MITINVLTLFPEMLEDYFTKALAGKALEKNLWKLNLINFRDYATDNHHTVDDTPYGGGAGMVLKCEPIEKAILDNNLQDTKFFYMSPRGEKLTQKFIKETIDFQENITILCGRYEGVDQRILDSYNMDEISIGDFVLSGGELPACIFIDAMVRLIPGVLGNKDTLSTESFEDGLLEHNQYTKPADWVNSKGLTKSVPCVLLSGNHKKIEEFRLRERIEITNRKKQK